MVTRKPRINDCQNESVVDLTPHFNASDCERRVSAAAALSRCIRWMQSDFGDHYALQCLLNETMRVKAGGK